jgi:hypothetical protein
MQLQPLAVVYNRLYHSIFELVLYPFQQMDGVNFDALIAIALCGKGCAIAQRRC